MLSLIIVCYKAYSYRLLHGLSAFRHSEDVAQKSLLPINYEFFIYTRILNYVITTSFNTMTVRLIQLQHCILAVCYNYILVFENHIVRKLNNMFKAISSKQLQS